MDGVEQTETAGAIGRLGAAVLDLERLIMRMSMSSWSGSRMTKELATRKMQEIYREPVKPELIAQRIQESRRRRWSSPPR